MTISYRHRALLAMSLTAPLLASCENTAPPPAASSISQPGAPATTPETVIGRTVASAIQKARTELETGNLDLSHGVNIMALMWPS